MALSLAARSTLIAPSATLAMGAEARRLKAKGIEVLDFALGEPDFQYAAQHSGSRFRGRPQGSDPLHSTVGDSRAPTGRCHPLYPTSPTADTARGRS